MFNWVKGIFRDYTQELKGLVQERQVLYNTVNFKEYYRNKCWEVFHESTFDRPYVVKYFPDECCVKFLFFNLNEDNMLELQQYNVSDFEFSFQDEDFSKKCSELYKKTSDVYSDSRDFSDVLISLNDPDYISPHERQLNKMADLFYKREVSERDVILDELSKDNIRKYCAAWTSPLEAKWRLCNLVSYIK